mmetsp:Transcript_10554/g.20315  ORF Transcript_10554/g.20315 Transcript_10554/m.20315 type:complete len:520 (+) Transcript_10554:134-1693(+)
MVLQLEMSKMQCTLCLTADCIEALVRAGAEVKGPAMQQTILSVATQGRVDVLERLVALGPDLEVRDREGKTPLLRAAEQNHSDCVRLLLQAGADHRARDNGGNTALHRAAQCGCSNSLRVLMDFGADICCLNRENKTPLQLAVAHRDCTSLLIQQKEQFRPNSGPSKQTFKKKPSKKPQARQFKRYERSDEMMLRNRERDYTSTLHKEDAKEQPSLLHLAPIQHTTRDQLIKALNADLMRFAKELDEWQYSTEPSYAKAIGTIEEVIKQVWPLAETKIYGSYSTKLHLPSSDIDLVLVNVEGTLAELQEVIKGIQGVEQIRLISSAYIPVLKIVFRQDHLKLQFDITLQDTRHRGLRACEFVKRVLSQSQLIKPIFMAFKQLFYWVDCHEAFKGGLSSYSLFLMTAYFFQQHRTTNPAETFLACLTYFANECDYSRPFLAIDPAHPEVVPNLRHPQTLCLYVPDPLCTTSNVAHPTNLQSVIAIFKYAYGSLVRPLVCECNKSPMWRMLQEAKVHFQAL